MNKHLVHSSDRALNGLDLSNSSGMVIPVNRMHKRDFIPLLLARNLQKKNRERIIMMSVEDQQGFDELFSLLFHHERSLLVRAADAVENITIKHPEYLQPHKAQIVSSLKSTCPKELKWHMARLVSRIVLTKNEVDDVWHILTYWAINKNENKIIRINALQGLFDLSMHDLELKAKLVDTIDSMEHEINPSIRVRIHNLKRKLSMS